MGLLFLDIRKGVKLPTIQTKILFETDSFKTRFNLVLVRRLAYVFRLVILILLPA